MKNNITKYNKCAICGACVNVCPVDAVCVQNNSNFYSVSVDSSKCINCGKCISVCPVNNLVKVQHLHSGYVGYVNDNKVLYTSSSGGIFYAIAQLVLEKRGVVYGAAFSEDSHTVEFKSTDEVPLSYLQKSKYVESNIGIVFRRIQRELDKGRQVLFCGTPCQAAGLKNFLKREYDNLVICDFSCGGLPSHKMYDEYLTSLEKKYKSKVKIVDFRPKNFGWENHSIFIQFMNGKIYTRLATLDPYYKAFFNSLDKREYCYQCDFSDNHSSDLILADCWLFKKISKMNNNHRGLSLVLTNSVKGEKIMEDISKQIIVEKIPLEKASYNIKTGHLSPNIIQRHNQFLKIVETDGFLVAVKKVLPSSILKEWKQWLKQILKRGKYERSKKNWN